VVTHAAVRGSVHPVEGPSAQDAQEHHDHGDQEQQKGLEAMVLRPVEDHRFRIRFIVAVDDLGLWAENGVLNKAI